MSSSLALQDVWLPQAAARRTHGHLLTYLQGRVVSTTKAGKGDKTKPSSVRKEHCLAAIFQLDEDLRRHASRLDELWDSDVISVELGQSIKVLVAAAIEAMDTTLLHKRSGAAPTQRHAKGLKVSVVALEKSTERLLTHEHPLALDLAVAIRDLCDDTAHYAWQITMAYSSFAVQDGKLRITNRPTNWAAKQALANVLQEYQSTHGAASRPKSKDVQAALESHGLAVPKRTIREWMRQYRVGTFHHFVQPKQRQ